MNSKTMVIRCMLICKHIYQVVPHIATAEDSKIANYRRLVAVNHGSQSEPTDGPTRGGRQGSVVEAAVVLVADM